KFWRLQANQWHVSDATDFVTTADHTPVFTIYVHGNQVDMGTAKSTARRVACILGLDDPHVGGELIAFTWPAGRVAGGPLNDVRVKATRSDCYGPALAQFISTLPADAIVNVIGHSYGARLAAVAFDDLATRQPARSGPVRGVLLGAAMSNNWLLPGMRCGDAMPYVESMLVTTNQSDRVLHWYPLLWGLRSRGPQALGDTGLACRAQLGDDLMKYHSINVTCPVGKSHDWQDYVADARVRQAIRQLMSVPTGEVVVERPRQPVTVAMPTPTVEPLAP
ncbi:MAG: alpha/beta hydrolase, partial [Planctomycetales bacterium]|nr:alpha/beta hydrolase [Planctomycetales bacterium]